jgi:hypothetical protein
MLVLLMYLQVHLRDTEPALKALGLDAGLTNGLTKLLRSSLALSVFRGCQTQELAAGQGQINTSGVVDVMARACIYYKMPL